MDKINNFWNKNRKKISAVILLLLLLSASIIAANSYEDHQTEKKTYCEFLSLLNKGEIESVSYAPNKETMTFTTNQGETYKTLYPDYEEFRKDLLEKGVEVKKTTVVTGSFFTVGIELIVLAL